jgi:hypothetical protein
MMKNKTIYLAKITKSRDYESDFTREMEAFEYMSDAEAFMAANNMERNSWGDWYSTLSCDIDGSITTLEVK